MSLCPDDDSAESDPLLLFATEPPTVAAPAPQVEVPKKIEPLQASPELDALVRRAETAERSLRESRKDAAALKRQLATLVSAATDNRAQARRSAATLGLAAACLLALVTIGWRFVPAAVPPAVAAAVPPAVAAAAPAMEPEVQPPPTESPKPIALVPAAVALPRRDATARARERVEPEPRIEYVGTLTIDAVPAGGEVFLNRKSVGIAPVRLTGLRAGSHLVWIRRDGYRRFTRVVLVPADQVSRVSVALEPETAPAVRP